MSYFLISKMCKSEIATKKKRTPRKIHNGTSLIKLQNQLLKNNNNNLKKKPKTPNGISTESRMERFQIPV